MVKTHFVNFLEFIRSRGVVGFAVGFILGKATSDLIGSFVNDIINPLIGFLTGSLGDLSKQVAQLGPVSIKYGNFLVILINFIVLAIVVYLLVKVARLEKLDKQG